MSKATKVEAAERTAIMLDLLQLKYAQNDDRMLSHVVIEEVAPATGFRGVQRYADAVALSVWPSGGMELDGWEIKASKGDLKRELKDPDKWRAVGRYCNRWNLIAWDESVLMPGIPSEWTVWITRETEYGRELKLHARGSLLTPEPWPRQFVCSLVRNAYVQSPGAAYVARAIQNALERNARDVKRAVENEHRELLRPLCKALGFDYWNAPKLEALVAEAVARLKPVAEQ